MAASQRSRHFHYCHNAKARYPSCQRESHENTPQFAMARARGSDHYRNRRFYRPDCGQCSGRAGQSRIWPHRFTGFHDGMGLCPAQRGGRPCHRALCRAGAAADADFGRRSHLVARNRAMRRGGKLGAAAGGAHGRGDGRGDWPARQPIGDRGLLPRQQARLCHFLPAAFPAIGCLRRLCRRRLDRTGIRLANDLPDRCCAGLYHGLCRLVLHR